MTDVMFPICFLMFISLVAIDKFFQARRMKGRICTKSKHNVGDIVYAFFPAEEDAKVRGVKRFRITEVKISVLFKLGALLKHDDVATMSYTYGGNIEDESGVYSGSYFGLTYVGATRADLIDSLIDDGFVFPE